MVLWVCDVLLFVVDTDKLPRSIFVQGSHQRYICCVSQVCCKQL